jgi:hypothetical protein
MNRRHVTGSQLKSAVRSAALKQLLHFGVKTSARKLMTTWSGSTAWASWSPGGSIRINYPSVAENSLFSRRDADLIVGYTLHEAGHVAFTEQLAGAVWRPTGGLPFKLFNGIEDARMEQAVSSSGKALGSRSAFKKLISKYTTTHLSPEFNPTSINCAPFALALVCRAAFGNGNGYAKTLLRRIPMPWQGWYAAAAEGIVKASLKKQGTEVSAALAREFLESWVAEFPDALSPPPVAQPQPPQPQSGEQEEDDESSDEEQLVEDESDESEDDDDSDEEQLSDDEDEDGDVGDDGEGADGDDSGEEQLSDEDGEPEGEDEGSEGSQPSGEPEVEDEVEDEGDDGNVGGDAGGSGEFSPVDDDRLDDRKLIDPEPNVDDIFKRAADRNKSPVALPGSPTVAVSDMSKWASTKGVDEEAYERLRKSAGMAALRSQLTRVLRAPELCGWDGGAVGGRFDGRRTPRMFAGSERVFKRRWVSPGVDTAVSVIVDLSGSMYGHRALAARDLAFAIADVVESARCDVEVMGFRHSQGASGGDHFDSRKTGHPTRLDGKSGGGGWERNGDNAVYVGSSKSELVLAKSFGKKLRQSSRAVASLPDLVGGGTPDYETVRTAVERLGAMAHQRKLCIVITDGFGEEGNMRKLCDAAPNLFGVDVVGFGIGCDPPVFNKVYPIGTAVTMDTMGKSTLKGVIKQLELRGERRVA